MSVASNAFLQGSPVQAATTLRPMRIATVHRNRRWPEIVASVGFAFVLAASMALKGAAEPLAFTFLSFAIFVLGAVLALSSSQPETNEHAYVRHIVAIVLIVTCLPFVQVAASLFSTLSIASATPRDSAIEALRLSGYVVLFTGLRHCLTTPHSARRGAMMLLGAIAALASLSLLNYDPDLSPLAHPGLTGPFENRSVFAALLGMGLCVAAAFASQPAHPRAHRPVFILFRTTCLLACAVLLVAIVQTQSRLGLASSILALGVILAFRLRRAWVSRAIIGALALAAVLVIADPSVLTRFESLPKDLGHRTDLYKQISELALASPYWGHGAGSFPVVFEQFQHPPVSSAFFWDYAHSTILTVTVELGAIATLAMAAATALAFFALAKRFRSHGEAPALAGCAAIVLACPHWLADFSFEIPTLAFFLIALIALGFGPKFPPEKEETS